LLISYAATASASHQNVMGKHDIQLLIHHI